MRSTELDRDHRLVVAAIDDLAGRLAVASADVAVIEARAVTWPDRGYGCPDPAVRHVQVPVDGVLIVLEAAGRRFEYHGGDPPRLCVTPGPGPDATRPPRSV